jgi:hypothetical protein
VRLAIADFDPFDVARRLLDSSTGRVRCDILLIVVVRRAKVLLLLSLRRWDFGRNFSFQVLELLFLLNKGLG